MSKALLIKSYTDITTGTQGQWNELTMARSYIQGIETTNGIYSGGGWDWLTPFSIFSGIGVVAMYATLGCAWLIMKTDAKLQDQMYKFMPKLLIVLLIIFLPISYS